MLFYCLLNSEMNDKLRNIIKFVVMGCSTEWGNVINVIICDQINKT